MATAVPCNISSGSIFCNLTANVKKGLRPSLFACIFSGIIGIPPNIIIIRAVYVNTLLRKPIYYFMANLAVCNLTQIMANIVNNIISNLFTKYLIPNHIQNILCKIFAIFPYYWSYTTSVQALILVSYERHQAVCRPFKRFTLNKVKLLCILAWIISLIIALPYLITATSSRSELRICTPYQYNSIWIIILNIITFLFQFAIPTTAMTIMHWLVLHRLTSKAIVTPQETATNKLLKRQAIYMLTTTVIFVIFSMPSVMSSVAIIITGTISSHLNNVNGFPVLQIIVASSGFLLPFTTPCNPIIFCIFHPNLRHALFCRANHLPKTKRKDPVQVIQISAS